MVEERWRTFSFWIWQGLQQDFEGQAMRDEDDALRKVDFPGGHSNILKSAESKMWTALQFYRELRGSSARGKTAIPQAINKIQS